MLLHRLTHFLLRVRGNHAHQLIEIAPEEGFQLWPPLQPLAKFGQLLRPAVLRGENADLSGVLVHLFQRGKGDDVHGIAAIKAELRGSVGKPLVIVAFATQFAQHDIQITANLRATLLQPVQHFDSGRARRFLQVFLQIVSDDPGQPPQLRLTVNQAQRPDTAQRLILARYNAVIDRAAHILTRYLQHGGQRILQRAIFLTQFGQRDVAFTYPLSLDAIQFQQGIGSKRESEIPDTMTPLPDLISSLPPEALHFRALFALRRAFRVYQPIDTPQGINKVNRLGEVFEQLLIAVFGALTGQRVGKPAQQHVLSNPAPAT